MSTSVQSFNTLMKQFLGELALTFPDHEEICLFQTMFDDLVRTNYKKPAQLFMGALQPYSDLVMQKNDHLFDQPISLGNRIDLSELWNTNGLSQTSKDAIWKYLHTLFLLGSTVCCLPPEILNTIDNLAKTCADGIKSGNVDLTTVTKSLLNGDILQGIGEDGMKQLEDMATNIMPMLSSMGMGGAEGGAGGVGGLGGLAGLGDLAGLMGGKGGMGGMGGHGNKASIAAAAEIEALLNGIPKVADDEESDP
jgi:hypothetical protein